MVVMQRKVETSTCFIIKIIPTLDAVGRINSITVKQQGNNYDANTVLSVRNFAVLVKTDETLLGKWAVYERENRTWNRIKSQSYNVAIFWNYIDWYANGYNETTDIDYLIENSYELTALDNPIGSVVKISNVGTGGWLLKKCLTIMKRALRRVTFM